MKAKEGQFCGCFSELIFQFGSDLFPAHFAKLASVNLINFAHLTHFTESLQYRLDSVLLAGA